MSSEVLRAGIGFPVFDLKGGPYDGQSTDDADLRVSFHPDSITVIGPVGTGSAVYAVKQKTVKGNVVKFAEFSHYG